MVAVEEKLPAQNQQPHPENKRSGRRGMRVLSMRSADGAGDAARDQMQQQRGVRSRA